jgi:hypothetical protein
VSRSAACLMSFVIASIVCVAVQAAEAEALPRLPLAYLEVDLDANDIVFDPVSGTLFASVGSAGGTYANSVVPIDPATGKLGEAIPVGLEPNKLALSGNGQYLYVGVDGESSVARVNIPLRIVDLRWHLGSGNPACGPIALGRPAMRRSWRSTATASPNSSSPRRTFKCRTATSSTTAACCSTECTCSTRPH